MLFNAYPFLFFFLPLVLLGFYWIGREYGSRISLYWLFFASLFFYAWWNPVFVILPVASILFNYYWVRQILIHQKRSVLWVGLLANLALLGFFKYTPFILQNIGWALNIQVPKASIFLPLAISFFTFQQIAYLVDAYQGKVTLDVNKSDKTHHTLLGYCTFIVFFPHFIAGPIVHHRILIPQLMNSALATINWTNIAVGLGIFTVGLIKKVWIADGWMLPSANLLFDATSCGMHLTFIEAWIGALAYTFQIYFDFSGYSDMAIGLARLFNVVFPINFNSPYKATSIIDFWRSWHITLSEFLRNYLYIPLGGNRLGSYQRYTNLMIVMLLGGLWHGASWTFMVWGGLHGVYLIINHAWRYATSRYQIEWGDSVVWKWLCRGLTFFAVVIGWVLFRADSFTAAYIHLKGLIGLNSFALPESMLPYKEYLPGILISDNLFLIFSKSGIIKNILWALGIVWLMPNTAEIFGDYNPAYNWKRLAINSWWQRLYTFRIGYIQAAVLGSALAYSVLLIHNQQSQFLYFQF